MVEELKKFKVREGHCNVPQNYSRNAELIRWVMNHRGKRLEVSREIVEKLDSIGFTWGTMKDARWEIMFEKLRKSMDRESHCNAPQKYSDNLGFGLWVSRQREKRLRIPK